MRAAATLGSIAQSGTGDDACSYLRENGYRYQVIHRTEDIALVPLTCECRRQ